MAHRIEFTHDAREHLRRLTAGDRAALLAAVRQKLSHEPQRQTRNRKRLRANALAPWVLGVRHLGAYHSSHPEFRELMKRSLERFKPGSGIPLEEIEREFAIAPKSAPRRRRLRGRRGR